MVFVSLYRIEDGEYYGDGLVKISTILQCTTTYNTRILSSLHRHDKTGGVLNRFNYQVEPLLNTPCLVGPAVK